MQSPLSSRLSAVLTPGPKAEGVVGLRLVIKYYLRQVSPTGDIDLGAARRQLFWSLTPNRDILGIVTIVIGDSLAVGFGAAAHIETHARVSASSCAIASFAPSGSVDVIVVSAGINDPPGRCLDSLRARLHARRVIWILPAPINSARAHVASVAAAHGDATCSYVTGPRSFHPRSYQALVRSCLGRP
jgi:hypothetical protein